jgi:hypothetical protein
MSRKHALLSASASSRWLNCTPSAVLESRIGEQSSSYADEGTTAHLLAEIMLQNEFGLITNLEYHSKLRAVIENEYYNDSMSEYVSDYVAFVVERFNGYRNAAIFLEQRFDLSDWVPFGFGTSDVSMAAPGVLEIIDLKYGKGVAVFAEENKQMMLYALGALKEFNYLGDVELVRMTICQPRIDNTSTWEISAAELLKWGETEVRQKAELAYGGEGTLQVGDWCRFCKVKSTCKAMAEQQLQLAMLEFDDLEEAEIVEGTLGDDPRHLTDEQIGQILLHAQLFKHWIAAVEEYALKRAVQEDKEWPGLKLVAGRSIRKYSDPEAVLQKLKWHGYPEEDVTRKKLLPITELERTLGKTTVSELVGDFIVKPPGGPSLVGADDKRPGYNRTANAISDFSE